MTRGTRLFPKDGVIVLASISIPAALLGVALLGFVVLLAVAYLLSPRVGLGSATGLGPSAANSASGRTAITIWASVPLQAPECACEPPPSAHIYSTLKDWHLESGYRDGPTVDSRRYLSITFDPSRASREQIVDLITANGGTVRPRPP